MQSTTPLASRTHC